VIVPVNAWNLDTGQPCVQNQSGAKMPQWRSPLTLARMAVIVLPALSAHAAAQTFMPAPPAIFDFSGGAVPQGSLAIGSDGVLYGTTVYGGTGSCVTANPTGCGTVFSLTPPSSPGGAWTETVLHDFGGDDGAYPYAGVVIGSGPGGISVLYGTTRSGGGTSTCTYPYEYNYNFGCGVVYSLTQDSGGTWTFAVLHAFSGIDGNSPAGSLAIVPGSGGVSVLYGTTSGGGAGSCPTGIGSSGCGTVFALTPSTATGAGGWTLALLHSFNFAEGSTPLAGVTIGSTPEGQPVLYGTASLGGHAPEPTYPGGPFVCAPAGTPGGMVDLGCGTVYSLTRNANGGSWTLTVLNLFGGGADGSNPSQPLVIGGSMANPVLYGTTLSTVFSLTGPASPSGLLNLAVLQSFPQPAALGLNIPPDNGWYLNGLVMGNGGILYGSASFGGWYSCPAGCGTVFSLSPPSAMSESGATWTETVLYRFATGGAVSPSGVLLGGGPGGVPILYGATAAGGFAGSGTVFSLALSPGLLIAPGGIVNAADFTSPVAPGGIASVFGNFLVPSPILLPESPAPTSVSGLAVLFGGGAPAPLLFASNGQLNIQVPWELAGKSQTYATAFLDYNVSDSQTVNLAPFSPAIFTRNAQGTGQGMILDLSYQVVDASNPVAAGGYIQIFCTGLGAVSNQPPTGSSAPLAPLSWTAATVTATIGGAPANVTFSGLAPGYVGLYQVNAQVPAGLAANGTAPVVLSVGGAVSNTATIAVQ